MPDPISSEKNQPKVESVNELARVITIYGTPFVLALVAFLLVLGAFSRGFYTGMRSLSAVLLPIVIGSCLYAFRKQILQSLIALPTWIGVLIGAVMGVVVMVGLRVFAYDLSVPIPELLVAGCFSVLVFSSASSPEDRGLALYYGTLLAILSYIVFFGLPLLNS